MTRTQRRNLLRYIKTRLDITWDDPATDAKIAGIIEDGIVYLDSKRGGEADYASPSLSRQMLAEYCRYARDGALDVFEGNYLSMLLAMQNEQAVKDYASVSVSPGQ